MAATGTQPPAGGNSIERSVEPPAGGLPARETLSQLLARILDQLSLSAWLPSASFVAIALVYANLRTTRGDIDEAVGMLGSLSAIGLVLLVICIVLFTLLTQAFEFEAIRFFEGYWGHGRIATSLANLLSNLALKRRNSLAQKLQDKTDEAFALARQRMLRRNIDPTLVAAIEAERAGASTADFRSEDLVDAAKMDWRDFARPADVRSMEALERAVSRYPVKDRRVLPMKLGNALRAHEELVYVQTEGRLEGYVLRLFDKLPPSLQLEHDQYRNRLDLYCSLCVVLFAAALAATPVLEPAGLQVVVTSIAMSLGLLLLSYRAAVASAMRYGSILLTIEEVRQQQQGDPSPGATTPP
jgi:hypothetical protein